MPFAFIVDGQTEKKILQRLCPGTPIRMTNLNGKDVSISALAKRISSLIKLLKGRYYPVLILVDRENRPQTAMSIEVELVDELTNCYGVLADDIVVSCPDRMIENWMLADFDLIKTTYNVDMPSDVEGQHGKSILRQTLFKVGIAYHELTIGVDILTKADPQELRKNSASFRRMAERTERACRWLRQLS